jgi:hypothetical protein
MAYHRQPCDSYFVEEAYPQRATQEYLKMMGRRKQEAMANELSRQASEAYMEDIIQHMHQMEVNCLDFTFLPPYANLLSGRDTS